MVHFLDYGNFICKYPTSSPGGAMRISPLGLACRNAEPGPLRQCVEQALLGTHRHVEAMDFAVLQAASAPRVAAGPGVQNVC